MLNHLDFGVFYGVGEMQDTSPVRRFLHSLERLELKFGLSSEFFDKIPVIILHDVLFRVFRFSKASLCALTSSFMTF